MSWQGFGDYFYYLIITGLIFYLFIFLIIIFGYFIFNVISKKILKITKEIPFIEKIFLSFGIGTSIYISLSFILLIFSAFNFFFAYLPLLLFDISYVFYQIIKSKKNFIIIKHQYYLFITKIKHNSKNVIVLCLTLVIIIIFQFNLQWPLFTESKALMFKDPYAFLSQSFYLLDNGLVRFSKTYPPGLIILCSGISLISKNYSVVYYFFKFGGIHLIFLFVFFIFYLTLKMFKKIYIAFSCSILFLSFYFYIGRANAFLSASVAILFVGISLICFLENGKFYHFIGFFIPLIYFINPVTFLYYISLVLVFFIIQIFFIDRKNFLENIKIVVGILTITFLLYLPYLLYIHHWGTTQFELNEGFLRIMFKVLPPTPTPGPAPGPPPPPPTTNIIQGLIDFFFGGVFSIDSSAFQTLLVFGLFSFLGLIYIRSQIINHSKRIHFVCRLSFLLILISYVIVIAFNLSRFPFFVGFHDRVFEAFSSFIVILCGFGIEHVKIIANKTVDYLKKNRFFNNRNFNLDKISKRIIKPENIFMLVLIPSLVSVRLSQFIILDTWTYYNYDNDTVDSYLYLRENIPTNSIVLTQNYSWHGINWMFYDMEVIITPFDNNTIFDEFELFITENSINYLLLNKSAYNREVFNNLLILADYENIYENDAYYIYSVKKIS